MADEEKVKEAVEDGKRIAVRVMVELYADKCRECDRLTARVDELQGEMTKLVEAQPHRRVREFFGIVGQTVRYRPEVPPTDELVLGLALVAEETFELLAACDVDLLAARGTGLVDGLGDIVKRRILGLRARYPVDGSVPANLIEVADALEDIRYVVDGMLARCGIDGRPIGTIVHNSNMTKANGPIDPETGKRLKPPGFVPPDAAIAAELRRQGWAG